MSNQNAIAANNVVIAAKQKATLEAFAKNTDLRVALTALWTSYGQGKMPAITETWMFSNMVELTLEGFGRRGVKVTITFEGNLPDRSKDSLVFRLNDQEKWESSQFEQVISWLECDDFARYQLGVTPVARKRK